MVKEDNNRNFEKMLEEYTEKYVKVNILKQLCAIAKYMTQQIDKKFQSYPNPVLTPGLFGNEDFPVWQGQMHDSTGVGVYDNGILKGYYPNIIGTIPQTDGNKKDIVGIKYLQKALEKGQTTFNKGIWIVLFSAVPYAERINEIGSSRHRGIDFFDNLSQYLETEVYSKIETIEL